MRAGARRRLLELAVLLVAPLSWPAARADESLPAQPVYSLPIKSASGVTWAGHFDTEWLANLGGGRVPGMASDMVGQLGFSVGSGYLRLPPGGRFKVTVLGVAARGRQSDQFGEVQTVSNNWAPPMVRLYDFYWRQRIGEGNTLRLGMMNVADYFGKVEAAGQLLNASFGLVPSISVNVPLTPTYPYTGTGAVDHHVAGSWSGTVGLFQGNPLKPGRPFRGGAMALAELDRLWLDGAGRAKVGAGLWRYRPAPGEASAWGCYGQAERQAEWGGRPLGLFLQWGASSGSEERVSDYVGLGVRLKQPWAGRKQDVLSLGVARAWLRGTPHPAETVLEATYIWRLDKWVALQPDLQWVLNPGGVNPDVLAGILRLHLEFF